MKSKSAPPGDPRSIRQTIIMKPLRSNKYAQNLEFHQVQTSASKVTITILVSVFIHVTNLGRSGTSNSYLDNNKFSYELGKAI